MPLVCNITAMPQYECQLNTVPQQSCSSGEQSSVGSRLCPHCCVTDRCRHSSASSPRTRAHTEASRRHAVQTCLTLAAVRRVFSARVSQLFPLLPLPLYSTFLHRLMVISVCKSIFGQGFSHGSLVTERARSSTVTVAASTG